MTDVFNTISMGVTADIVPVLLGQKRVGEEHLSEGGFVTAELNWRSSLHVAPAPDVRVLSLRH